MILSFQLDWETIGKVWGPMGIVFVLVMIGAVYAVRKVTGFLSDTVVDARKERDYMRDQRVRETEAFLKALELRDTKMVEGFSKILDGLDDIKDMRTLRNK